MFNAFWIDFLCWLFIIGVFLNLSFSIAILLISKNQIKDEREYHRQEIEKIRDEYRRDRDDLADRLMAGSYAEYESLKQKEYEQPRKHTSGNNFLKRSIDIAERNYQQERIEIDDD